MPAKPPARHVSGHASAPDWVPGTRGRPLRPRESRDPRINRDTPAVAPRPVRARAYPWASPPRNVSKRSRPSRHRLLLRRVRAAMRGTVKWSRRRKGLRLPRTPPGGPVHSCATTGAVPSVPSAAAWAVADHPVAPAVSSPGTLDALSVHEASYAIAENEGAACRPRFGPSHLMRGGEARSASRAHARDLANSAAAEAPISKNQCRVVGCAVSARIFPARLPVDLLFLILFCPRGHCSACAK